MKPANADYQGGARCRFSWLYNAFCNQSRARVIQFHRRDASIVRSRRVILEERREALKAQTLTKVHEGATLRDRVATLVSYGAFTDLEGVNAILHSSDIPDL